MNFIKIVFYQILVLLCVCKFSIGQFMKIPIGTSIKNSQYIFEGRVISSTPFLAADSNIYTSNIVKISKIFKGNIRCGDIEITTQQDAHLPGTTKHGNAGIGNNILVFDGSGLYKGNTGIFLCTKTYMASLSAPKENPKNIQLYVNTMLYQIQNGDTLAVSSGDTSFPSVNAAREFFCSQTGHLFTSCGTFSEPNIRGGVIQENLK